MTGRFSEPMSTLRFELMREGLEDHEYLWMLREWVARHRRVRDGDPDSNLLSRARALLARAEAAGGNYTGAGGEYFFDGYLQEPVRLLALRHDIGELLQQLFAAGRAAVSQSRGSE